MHSLNPEYKPYEISVSEIKEVWKFVNYISSEFPEPSLPKNELQQSINEVKKDLNEIKNRLSLNKS